MFVYISLLSTTEKKDPWNLLLVSIIGLVSFISGMLIISTLSKDLLPFFVSFFIFVIAIFLKAFSKNSRIIFGDFNKRVGTLTYSDGYLKRYPFLEGLSREKNCLL